MYQWRGALPRVYYSRASGPHAVVRSLARLSYLRSGPEARE